MHVQARAVPAASPADLEAFLKVLSEPGGGSDRINIEGVAGADIEGGGRIVFAVEHGKAEDANRLLVDAGYTCEWTNDLYAEKIPPDAGSGGQVGQGDDPNQPGVLLGIVRRANEGLTDRNRKIDTVMIGAFTNEPGRFYAQVTFSGAAWQDTPPDDNDG